MKEEFVYYPAFFRKTGEVRESGSPEGGDWRPEGYREEKAGSGEARIAVNRGDCRLSSCRAGNYERSMEFTEVLKTK